MSNMQGEKFGAYLYNSLVFLSVKKAHKIGVCSSFSEIIKSRLNHA